MRASVVVPALALAAALLAPADADARAERTVSQAIERVWPTAVRFLRVDEGMTIVDKDADAGYVIFELTDRGKVYRGALELVAFTEDDGKKAVRLVVTIAERPEYTEAGLLDRLLQKVRKEHGDPRPPAPPPEPAPAPAKPGDKPPKK